MGNLITNILGTVSQAGFRYLDYERDQDRYEAMVAQSRAQEKQIQLVLIGGMFLTGIYLVTR